MPNLYPITGPWLDADLATAACPRGNDMLADELRRWKDSNIEVVVSALSPEEMRGLGVLKESELCNEIGLEYVQFSIVNREAPATIDAVGDLVDRLGGYLAAGRSVVIHCRAGIGRASLLAACTLVRAGVDADEAFARISLARGVTVPDTSDQREWVRRFAGQNRSGDK